jgi:hypothetical protein
MSLRSQRTPEHIHRRIVRLINGLFLSTCLAVPALFVPDADAAIATSPRTRARLQRAATYLVTHVDAMKAGRIGPRVDVREIGLTVGYLLGLRVDVRWLRFHRGDGSTRWTLGVAPAIQLMPGFGAWLRIGPFTRPTPAATHDLSPRWFGGKFSLSIAMAIGIGAELFDDGSTYFAIGLGASFFASEGRLLLRLPWFSGTRDQQLERLHCGLAAVADAANALTQLDEDADLSDKDRRLWEVRFLDSLGVAEKAMADIRRHKPRDWRTLPLRPLAKAKVSEAVDPMFDPSLDRVAPHQFRVPAAASLPMLWP